jgi:DNA-binding response OmpR family regulator
MSDMNFNILVLETDPDTLVVLDDVLTDEGCFVDVVASGVDALHHLKDNTPHLIIGSADVTEPNGLDVCYRTKRIKRLRSVPVLIVADRDDQKLRDHITLSHADMSLVKPLDPDLLREVVRQLLTRSVLAGLDTPDIDPRGTLILNMTFED